MKKIILLLLLASPCRAQKFSSQEISNWKKQIENITLIRDLWGVAHVYGKTDADAVFGMLYAQCEDDFPRVERNYLTATARMAEAEGENFIYHDLRMRLFIDTVRAIAVYQESPAWMKKLCNAFADGVNYYLYTHPQTQPKLLTRFQPWMPFLFSEGSIGGDIESVSLNEIKEFYGKQPGDLMEEVSDDGLGAEPRGSNGIAISPSISATGNALFLINPHTSFYFRSELQVTSEEGLNAYGAATWGQFFIYQGFNEHCGWMHTSSQADVIDEYREAVVKKNRALFYKYGSEVRPLTKEKISIAYRNGNIVSRKEFITYRSHHGPVVASRGGKWITVKLMVEPLKALTQSYQRTRAKSLEEFRKTMELRTNSSNNTVYADDQGNIAYWHGNFMPKRDPQFNWNEPVDGSNPATEWKGLHETKDMIHLINPANGWIQNCNATPFTAAGENSPKPGDYPSYMAPDAENARGLHAVKLLQNQKDFTLDKLIATSRDPYLPGFEKLLPSFIKSFEATRGDSLLYLGEPIQLLTDWNLRWSAESVPTTLAIFWAQKLRQNMSARIPPRIDQLSVIQFLQEKTTAGEKLQALKEAVADLQRDFGTWKITWGEVNRFQRLGSKFDAGFDDGQPSLAVPFTSSFWGSLAAFGSRRYPNTKKMYGNVGNSFIAVVEFGKRVKAKSVMTGGASGDTISPHFKDQASMYCDGKFKDVLFYKEDVLKHAERSYHPGE
ncbi:MAG TPA: penicillin acylase family protein [Cyclobacteriaceae bacterium]|nr:penicillin acylase family protein [Cyclobacteriaceae bacterium]